MSRKRTFITHAVAFLAGCLVMGGALVGLGAYLVETESAQGRAVSLLKRWGAYIDEHRFLTIPVPGKGLSVHIRSDGPASASDEYGDDIVVVAEKEGPIFTYRLEGEWGVPSARYGAGEATGHYWDDHGVDGLFDLHFDMTQKAMEIRTHDDWITARKITKGRAATAEGTFTFDAKRGHWKRVDE